LSLSRGGRGRPRVSAEVRTLIRRISPENPLWGAPHILGELLKLGHDICQSSIAKYMIRRSCPPRQTWQTFIRNHMTDIVARAEADSRAIQKKARVANDINRWKYMIGLQNLGMDAGPDMDDTLNTGEV
jgi:hypothetical protein